MKKNLHIQVFGKVQGVFYRASAEVQAQMLKLTGFARNEPDGSVTLEAEGDEEDLQVFLEWNHHGPRGAQVDKIEYLLTDELKHFTHFTIE